MRTVFVGDVHGCSGELRSLLREIGFEAGADRLLLTGDAFSRGPDPAGVWQVIGETGAEMVLGNHDDRLLRQLGLLAQGQEIEYRWPDQRTTVEQLLPVAGELLPWLREVPLWIEEEQFLLVHAGIDPEAGLARTTRKQFLSIRLWPPGPGVDGPRWHQHIEPPAGTVVFGHDAPGGLVRVYREGESEAAGDPPCLLGLDTGCVYGGRLSAWLLEERRLVQVDSERTWFGSADR